MPSVIAGEVASPLNMPLSNEPLPYEQNRIPQTMQFPGSAPDNAMAGLGAHANPLTAMPVGAPAAPVVAAAAFPGNMGAFGAGAIAGAAAVPSATAAPYSPASSVAPSLFSLQDNHLLPLTSARLIIGRDSSSDIQLSDSNISRSHAELFFNSDGRWFIRDLGSTNGTKINGRRITESPLSHGDIITVGVTRLEFREH